MVRVADAHGAPPNIPFWLGEAPARSDELSTAVSELRADAERWLVGASRPASGDANDDFACWMRDETGVCEAAAEQAVDYLADGCRTLGVIPTQETLVLERFFDESGGMQLVLHAPFGSRINRAWGWRCASGSAASSTSSCRRRRPKTRCCCRSGRSTRFRSPTCSAICIPPRCATSWSRRFSMRRSSRPGGAGTRRSRSPCRGTAAGARCRRSCSACRPTT